MINRVQLQPELQKPYDRILFATNVLSPVFGSCLILRNSAIPSSVLLNNSENRVIQSVAIYGSINLEDGTEITCYEIILQPSVRIEHAKVAIQQYIRKLLVAGQIALVNFVAPQNKNVWRLTLVAKDSVLTGQGIKEETTHPKRYTFLLGPSESCKTAAERFEILSTQPKINFQTLVNAFSVERLSKAFFDEYTRHYIRFCDYLQTSNFRTSVFKLPFDPTLPKVEIDSASKPIRDFVKKLLGRMVFLYFVQKKGWLGASDTHYKDGLPDFIKQLFIQSGGNATFYPNWLSVLFFETLNQERKNDDFRMPDGKMVKVPFLNGGLFDKDAFDDALLTLPAELFHHPDFQNAMLTERNGENARGFLDFLDAFNFTVHEDSPDDHTVAVDPEMLGHIFENLLEDNKDKGAFYTPKKIVHFMCQESLMEYLRTHCPPSPVAADWTEERIRLSVQSLVVEKEMPKELWPSDQSFLGFVTHIDTLLDSVKICDPAIGSGAFPMGLLQEIYTIKEVIAYELQQPWKPEQVKENIIQNSVYGVDIEKGAVDIARLRFWLSLLVDEELPKALPNLDYKIIVGNSLVSKLGEDTIGIDWNLNDTSHGLFGSDLAEQKGKLLHQISTTQQAFFNSINDKKKLAAVIRNLKIDLLINQLELMVATKGLESKPTGTGRAVAAQTELYIQTEDWKRSISQLKILKNDSDKPLHFFEWKLDFPEVLNALLNPDPGFDIVIGNPPFVQLSRNNGLLAKEFEKQGFETFERTGDIYSLFYEKGIQLLKNKGILTFITSNKWMRAAYGASTRAYFAKHNPRKLIDLGSGVFDTATVDTNILLIQKAPNQHQCFAADLSKTKTQGFKQLPFILLNNLGKDAWTIASEIEQSIHAKIERMGKPLKDWDVQIYRGVLTGFNEAFIIDGNTKDQLIAQDPRSADILKPILRGRDIKRYKADFADLWLIATFPARNLDIDHYPAVKAYLKSFGKRLHQTGETFIDQNGQKAKTRKKTGNKWFETQDQIGYYKEFEKEKIIYPNMTLFLPFVFDDCNYYTNQKCFIICTKSVSLKFLISFLNSKISHRWIRMNCPELQGGTRELSKIFFENIPVPSLTGIQQQPFISLVDQILQGKEEGLDTTALEQQIDHLVYHLYALSYEEVQVIDPTYPLSSEEYARIGREAL